MKSKAQAKTSPIKGRWFLVYSDFDGMENELGSARTLVKVGLKSCDEDGALREARKKCPPLRAYKGWDDRFYPVDPKVIYEIDLAV
jgi:hypothetical protein